MIIFLGMYFKMIVFTCIHFVLLFYLPNQYYSHEILNSINLKTKIRSLMFLLICLSFCCYSGYFIYQIFNTNIPNFFIKGILIIAFLIYSFNFFICLNSIKNVILASRK